MRKVDLQLTNLSTDELQRIERVISDLYRARHETIIYDDDYGIWTEQDQVSVAADILKLLDKSEN